MLHLSYPLFPPFLSFRVHTPSAKKKERRERWMEQRLLLPSFSAPHFIILRALGRGWKIKPPRVGVEASPPPPRRWFWKREKLPPPPLPGKGRAREGLLQKLEGEGENNADPSVRSFLGGGGKVGLYLLPARLPRTIPSKIREGNEKKAKLLFFQTDAARTNKTRCENIKGEKRGGGKAQISSSRVTDAPSFLFFFAWKYRRESSFVSLFFFFLLLLPCASPPILPLFANPGCGGGRSMGGKRDRSSLYPPPPSSPSATCEKPSPDLRFSQRDGFVHTCGGVGCRVTQDRNANFASPDDVIERGYVFPRDTPC